MKTKCGSWNKYAGKSGWDGQQERYLSKNEESCGAIRLPFGEKSLKMTSRRKEIDTNHEKSWRGTYFEKKN
ncbi:hypothetical protein [Fusibacillus kribbianus]|uniref:Uncharacterized protein n=1 Tax=Fusibacillus kribbianus TaxID=3044208 RepID=A0AAP4EXW9_9FIRM|nr:hypothetical protein [Ruminococcus sp. YH-rum2234]MDI9241271.1 hypothetical protein [Ruminococcus sp. YH-rum2234]